MLERIRRIDKRGIVFFLSIVGPGIITANVDNDAGGIATYSVAGAQYGYALLWSLIPMLVVLFMIQEMVARLGVVTGKGLSDLIREQYGVRVTFFTMLALLITNFGNITAEFAGLAASLEIFGVSRYVSVPLGAAAVWYLVVWGNYRIVEKVFLFACTVYLSYVISGFMANPPWGEVLTAMVIPTFRLEQNYLFMLIGIIGTTIAPWMQFYLQSSVVDKGLKAKDYKYLRMDVVLGSFTVNLVAFFIIMLCAVTIFQAGIRIETAKDAALALAPLAGDYSSWLFAVGLLNASLFAASILPLSTAYTICEAFGWESSLDRKFVEAPHFYGLYSLMIFVSAGIILLPDIPLISIMFYTQVANGLLLPVVLLFMLYLINDRRIMGTYVNGPAMNIVAWGTVIVLIGMSVAMVIFSLLA